MGGLDLLIQIRSTALQENDMDTPRSDMDAAQNPWQVRQRTCIYDNPWITVTHHDVLTPQGQPGIYGTVHFKNHAIGILPLDADGYTWLVGQYRFPLQRYSWEIPEGGAPLGSDPLAGAKRELREETGLEARTWRKLLEMDLSNAVSDERATAYLATDIRVVGSPEPDPTEALCLRRLAFDEACNMVANGLITDALSVATILKVQLLLKG